MRITRPDRPLSDGVVLLRPWEPGDVPPLVAAIDGDPVITSWLDQIPQPFTREHGERFVRSSTTAWEEGARGAFAVIDSRGPRLLGSVALHPVNEGQETVEIDYWVVAAARGEGAATRAAALTSHWALDRLGARRVQLRADVENVGSCRVAEKAGFVREGVLHSIRRNKRQGGRRIDWAIYALLADGA